MVEVSLTIGKLDASLALLLTKDHHLIEFPTVLLPDGVVAGSVVKIKCDRDLESETKEKTEFEQIQDEILKTFGEKLPKAPVLKIRNITQTSCVLEWDKLDLATSTIRSLNLYKDGVRLGQIPNPLQNTTTKLSGLPVDTEYKFQLKLTTTAGVFKSEEVVVKTHKMTDLSGITVCLGEIDDPRITREKIEEALRNVNAKPLQDKVLVDTTHFICTKPAGKEWKKLLDSNIPIVRPEWLKSCELERRIIGVRMFYLGADEDVLKQRDYWGSGEASKPLPEQPTEQSTEVVAEPAEQVSQPVDESGSSEPAESTSEPVAVEENLEPEPIVESSTDRELTKETASEPVPEEAPEVTPVEAPELTIPQPAVAPPEPESVDSKVEAEKELVEEKLDVPSLEEIPLESDEQLPEAPVETPVETANGNTDVAETESEAVTEPVEAVIADSLSELPALDVAAEVEATKEDQVVEAETEDATTEAEDAATEAEPEAEAETEPETPTESPKTGAKNGTGKGNKKNKNKNKKKK